MKWIFSENNSELNKLGFKNNKSDEVRYVEFEMSPFDLIEHIDRFIGDFKEKPINEQKEILSKIVASLKVAKSSKKTWQLIEFLPNDLTDKYIIYLREALSTLNHKSSKIKAIVNTQIQSDRFKLENIIFKCEGTNIDNLSLAQGKIHKVEIAKAILFRYQGYSGFSDEVEALRNIKTIHKNWINKTLLT